MRWLARLAPGLLILAPVALASCSSPASSQSLRLTGFAKVSIFSSSGPTTRSLDRHDTERVLSVLQGLPRVTKPSCNENALLYKLVATDQATGKTAYAVEGWQCASVVAETRGRATTWLSDRRCSLLEVVKASLPARKAAGTRTGQCVRTGPT